MKNEGKKQREESRSKDKDKLTETKKEIQGRRR
jgi:hypothetical protein